MILREHMLKHASPFVCDVLGCSKRPRGFSTINDLERHKKSIHQIGVTASKSYKCAALSCGNKGKIWPRLDNLKQHIERMHKDEDMADLVQR